MKIRHPKISNLADMAKAGLRFPSSVEVDGATYYATGKLGTHIATGRPTAEYELFDMGGTLRCWAFSDGSIATVNS